MLIPRPLLEDIANNRCLPFIGAGFSRNAQLPDDKQMLNWKELTEGLAKDLKTRKRNPLKVASEYEQVYGRVQLIETVRKLLRVDEARPGVVHRHFAKITSFDTIYSTNFDFLLEEAYQQENRPHRVLVGERQLAFHAGPTTANIIKMHGDLRHEAELILTEEDYDNYLRRHPVIGTHLSSMLITRTALFLGYSLTDPNFQQIRSIIKERLGNFTRMSYIVMFDAHKNDILEHRKQNLYVINLKSNPKSRSELLLDFLKEVYEYTTLISVERVRSISGATFEHLDKSALESAIKRKEIPVLESASNICYVMMPFDPKFNIVYFDVIKPLIETYGLRPMRADELMPTAGTLLDQIIAVILQSKLLICDLTTRNSNVMYELGIALANKKSLIILSQSTSDIPSDVTYLRSILYENTSDGLKALYKTLEEQVKNLLLVDPLEEAKRLIEQGLYRSAVSIMMSYLELTFRNLLRKYEIPYGRLPFKELTDQLLLKEIIDRDQLHQLNKWWEIRNRVVHELYQPGEEQSIEMLKWIEHFTERIGR